MKAETLAQLESDLVDKAGLRPAEAADRIALHLGRAIKRAVSSIGDSKRVDGGAELSRRIFGVLQEFVKNHDALVGDTLHEPTEVLTAIRSRQPDGSTRSPVRPLTPLLDTALLTNARDEPNVGRELKAEIDSADRIDVIMAFIRLSGLRPLLDGLRDHCRAGRRLRVLTTVYTGTTEAKALQELVDLGAEVRVRLRELLV